MNERIWGCRLCKLNCIMKNKICSKLPIVYFTWIILSVGIPVTLLLSGVNLFYAIFASAILSCVLYFLLARFACIVEMDDRSIVVTYVFPFNKRVEINLADVRSVGSELSYFFIWSDDFKMGRYYWYHPYDTFLFLMDDSDAADVLQINTSYMATIKLHTFFREYKNDRNKKV